MKHWYECRVLITSYSLGWHERWWHFPTMVSHNYKVITNFRWRWMARLYCFYKRLPVPASVGPVYIRTSIFERGQR